MFGKLQSLQKEIDEFDRTHYPKNNSVRMTLGVIEECGELEEAIEKFAVEENEANLNEIKNAVSDIIVFSMQLASFEGFDWESNLGDKTSSFPSIGVSLGKLSHHILKREQGLGKPEEHLLSIKEQLCNVGLYCIEMSNNFEFDWQEAFIEVVEGEVLKRSRKEREEKYGKSSSTKQE